MAGVERDDSERRCHGVRVGLAYKRHSFCQIGIDHGARPAKAGHGAQLQVSIWDMGQGQAGVQLQVSIWDMGQGQIKLGHSYRLASGTWGKAKLSWGTVTG